ETARKSAASIGTTGKKYYLAGIFDLNSDLALPLAEAFLQVILWPPDPGTLPGPEGAVGSARKPAPHVGSAKDWAKPQRRGRDGTGCGDRVRPSWHQVTSVRRGRRVRHLRPKSC